MSEPTLPPGPWTLDREMEDGLQPGEVDDLEVLDADGFTVATIDASPILNNWSDRYPGMKHWAEGSKDGRTQRHRTAEEVKNAASLFLAAPDLLAAARAARTALDDMMGDTDLNDDGSLEFRAMQALSAAIAKAERRQ